MEQTEHRKDVVADAIAMAKQASEMRELAIAELLSQQAQIEANLKALGYVGQANHNGNGAKRVTAPSAVPVASKRLRGLTLGTVAQTLLAEHGTLHGKDIERLAKAEGFKGGTKNFQNYLPVALKRAGGFENIGGNRWKLNNAIQPVRG